MLAVRGVMDALRRSTSFGTESGSLMRQPSAEDLDAAHQLVSSARGERHVSHITHDDHVSEAATERPHQSRPSPIPEASDVTRSPSELAEQREDVSDLGQVCRYVFFGLFGLNSVDRESAWSFLRSRTYRLRHV